MRFYLLVIYGENLGEFQYYYFAQMTTTMLPLPTPNRMNFPETLFKYLSKIWAEFFQHSIIPERTQLYTYRHIYIHTQPIVLECVQTKNMLAYRSDEAWLGCLILSLNNTYIIKSKQYYHHHRLSCRIHISTSTQSTASEASFLTIQSPPVLYTNHP